MHPIEELIYRELDWLAESDWLILWLTGELVNEIMTRLASDRMALKKQTSKKKTDKATCVVTECTASICKCNNYDYHFLCIHSNHL